MSYNSALKSEYEMAIKGKEVDLLPDEDIDLKREILEVIGEEWLYARNAWFSGQAPAALIGTPEEPKVRNVVRSIKAADFS